MKQEVMFYRQYYLHSAASIHVGYIDLDDVANIWCFRIVTATACDEHTIKSQYGVYLSITTTSVGQVAGSEPRPDRNWTRRLSRLERGELNET